MYTYCNVQNAQVFTVTRLYIYSSLLPDRSPRRQVRQHILKCSLQTDVYPSLPVCAYHTGKQSECLQVLQDVAVLGGDEDHVELLQRLVHIANAVCFHKGVLLARVHQFRKRS